MSLEVLLIPIGIAAVAAWREHQRTDLCEKCKATRIGDRNLLLQSLQAMGATDLLYDDERVRGSWQGHTLTFQRVGEVFLGRVDQGSEAQTNTMLTALDTALGSLAQRQNLALAKERAAVLGLQLVSEHVNDDGSVDLVFEEAT